MLAADLVPGNPDAVGRADSRFTEVRGQLLGGDHVFSIGRVAQLRGVRVIPGVNDKRPVHADRLLLLVLIEDHTAPKAAHTRLARAGEHRIGPNRNHPGGSHRFLVVVEREVLQVEIERGTAGEHEQGWNERDQQHRPVQNAAAAGGKPAGGIEAAVQRACVAVSFREQRSIGKGPHCPESSLRVF
ncbi:MAG: hypothetical protein AB7U20_13725 [Planctomycetaceae bacterium]